MEIVIKIPEEDYKYLIREDNFDGLYLTYYEKLIVNGTPLPKGHGRLIDADDVYNALRPYVSFSDLYDVLDEIPTIIEAEGGNEDAASN